jgi:hypothetical protein
VVCLREVVGADIAEAELIKLAACQLMQPIHHVIVTTLERLVNTGGLQDHQFKGSFQEEAS